MLRVLQGRFGADRTYWVTRPAAKGVVVFFPGDQLEHALSPPEIRRLQDPKVQAQLMAGKFEDCSCFVVMPSRLEGSYACFDHFLEKVTRSGEPLGYQGSQLKASSQLADLLASAFSTRLRNDIAYHLVGFSKGGVVLNQVLSEAAHCWQQLQETAVPGNAVPEEVSQFLQNVGEVHFLDAGLNCRGAHLTDPQILQSLSQWTQQSSSRMNIHLHGTPRQWDDPRRPWVGQEKERFKLLLRSNGLLVHEHRYFDGDEPTLLMHFQAIEAMQG